MRRAALGLQLFGGGAALRFNRAADLVEADQRKGVVIDILETHEHAAPGRLIAFGCRCRRGRVVTWQARLFIDDATKAWCAPKADAASAPFAIRRRQVLRHEDDLGRAADHPALRRVGFWLNEREHRRAIGRSDRQQPLTRLHARVKRDPKSQRVLKELEASLLVSDVDVHRVNTEEGIRHRLSIERRPHEPDYRDTARAGAGSSPGGAGGPGTIRPR